MIPPLILIFLIKLVAPKTVFLWKEYSSCCFCLCFKGIDGCFG